MWDNMEEMKNDIEDIKENIPNLEARILELESLIEVEKRRTWAYSLFRQADPDNTVSYTNC